MPQQARGGVSGPHHVLDGTGKIVTTFAESKYIGALNDELDPVSVEAILLHILPSCPMLDSLDRRSTGQPERELSRNSTWSTEAKKTITVLRLFKGMNGKFKLFVNGIDGIAPWRVSLILLQQSVIWDTLPQENSFVHIHSKCIRRTSADRQTQTVTMFRTDRCRRSVTAIVLSARRHVLALLVFFSFMATRQACAQAAKPNGMQAPHPWGQNPNGMHIYIWAGLKSHSAGQHDYPQFLADWSKILTEHGAVVDGALHGPRTADLAHTDVIIIYKGDAGYLSNEEKTALDAYIRRGGGLVSIHDSLCGPDPAYFATLVGGAKKHGEVNYTLGAPIAYTVTDPAHPIMKGMTNITIWDEAFFKMTWARDPGIHVLATTVIPGTPSAGTHKGEVVPQIWTYEHTLAAGQPARAFVWMQGHEYANFANYQIQQMLLRGIAWAGKKPVDSLVDYVPPSPRIQAPAPAR